MYTAFAEQMRSANTPFHYVHTVRIVKGRVVFFPRKTLGKNLHPYPLTTLLCVNELPTTICTRVHFEFLKNGLDKTTIIQHLIPVTA